MTRPRLRRPGRRALAAGLAVVVVLGAAFLWFRSSSLVAVKRVRVAGLSGPNVTAIRQALVNSALTMTTLDYSTAKLRSSVAGFPYIHALTVSTSFPHGLTITVDERVPIAAVESASREVAVDAAGLLLSGTSTAGLPIIPLRYQPGGTTLQTAGARAALRVLAAAPYRLLGHIASATSSASHGVIVQMRAGPQLYFGSDQQLAQKWQATLLVLADPSSTGAQYIDVSDPERPAAGTH